MKSREAQHDIVLAKFSWPSTLRGSCSAQPGLQYAAQDVWPNIAAISNITGASSSSPPIAPTRNPTEHIAASDAGVLRRSLCPDAPSSAATEHFAADEDDDQVTSEFQALPAAPEANSSPPPVAPTSNPTEYIAASCAGVPSGNARPDGHSSVATD